MTDPNYSRSPELCTPTRSRVLVVDMQERLLPHIAGGDEVVRRCRQVLKGAELFGVPVSATEQYPKGLGPTIPEVKELLGEIDISEKLRFSSAEAAAWGPASDSERDFAILIGIEAHVCVAQTAYDLLADGYRVLLVVDAIGSRHEPDRSVALERLALAGAIPTTAEALLFEWCEVAGTDVFKQLSKLVTDA